MSIGVPRLVASRASWICAILPAAPQFISGRGCRAAELNGGFTFGIGLRSRSSADAGSARLLAEMKGSSASRSAFSAGPVAAARSGQ